MKKTVLALLALVGLLVPLAVVQITSNAVAQIGGGVYGGPIYAPGGTLTAPLLFPDGTAALPAMAFASEPALGFYRSGASAMYYTQGGTPRLRISNAVTAASDGSFRFVNSTNALSGTVDVGLSRIAAGVMGVGSGNSGNTTGTMQMQTAFINKVTQSGTAPGAGILKLEVVAGTVGGSCRLIAYAGTSTTPVTVLDSIGSGC